MRPVPVLDQYQRIKREHQDAIVLFRLGDFYETFGGDAEQAAPILGITLTSRELGKGHRLPMAGVPYHACQLYIGKLLRAGLRVALCDQVEDAPARGLVRREVVRVLTPGMVLEEAYLDSRRSNYAVALALRPHHHGLAALDCSTGELAVIRTEASDDAVRDELARLHPAEVIVAETDRERVTGLLGAVPTTFAPAADFDSRAAGDRLRELLGVDTLAAFGCEEWPEALGAAGALLQHAARARLAVEPALIRLHAEHPQAYMHLDASTRRSLGLGGGGEVAPEDDLVAFLDETVTPIGARTLRRMIDRPLRDRGPLEQRLDQVESVLADALGRARLRKALQPVHDLERLVSRAGQGLATPRDLQALRVTLDALPAITGIAAVWPAIAWSEPPAEVAALARTLEGALVTDPPATLREGGVILPGHDSELDAIRDGSRVARDWIAGLEGRERERTGIRSLRVGFNQVFGYSIEIGHANRAPLPAEYVRKQTMVNAERYITPELKEKEALVLNARSAMVAREQVLFRALCERVAQAGAPLLEVAARLGTLDALQALAEVASREAWTRPAFQEAAGVEIMGGRHPLIEHALGPGRFVPNDLHLEASSAQVILLSGPNMAGKSTYLRQTALVVLLAQVGSFVPAAHVTLGLVDRIFTRVGARDELSRGLSTFMLEMVETAHILAHASPRSLLIFDEVGRGTSTYDGVSIAQALLEYIHDAPQLHSLTLFATHYHELTALAQRLERVRNYRMEVREDGDQVVFLHQVVEGGADRSYGIHVAQLAGLPRQVVLRARQVLRELEGQRPLEPAAPLSTQLPLPLEQRLVLELQQLDLERLTPREALDKLFAWQLEHARH